MYAYVDETGNTGVKLLDEAQPLFATAALLTRSDYDVRFEGEIRTIARSLGSDEIHANQLGLGRLEPIAPDLLKVIRKAGPRFALARVEKRYILATKVFDTIFDSFENKAVPWHIYNLRPLRLLMAFKVASLLDDTIGATFWDALMDARPDRARAKMADFCRELNARTGRIPDERSREVIAEALAWAADHPEALEFVYSDAAGRRGHSPNMVGFGNLLAGIEMQSNAWGRPVDVIRHDRQQQFARNIKDWHQMYSNALPDVVRLPLGEKMVLRKVFGSRLEISTAKESAGIQTIDVILWLFVRALRGDGLPENCQRLLDYVYGRAVQDDFSFAGVGTALEAFLDHFDQLDIPTPYIGQALLLRDDLERCRQLEMSAFEDERCRQELPEELVAGPA